MSATDRLLEANRAHAEGFDRGGLEARPSTGVAVVTCMDARIDPYRTLGLQLGEAHVIRNAGAVVTDEVIRSLTISQHKLGTTEVMLIGHKSCGLEGLDGDEFASKLDEEVREPREWSIGAFENVDDSVRQGVERIRSNAFLSRTESVRGFVYDVDAGALREVE